MWAGLEGFVCVCVWGVIKMVVCWTSVYKILKPQRGWGGIRRKKAVMVGWSMSGDPKCAGHRSTRFSCLNVGGAG